MRRTPAGLSWVMCAETVEHLHESPPPHTQALLQVYKRQSPSVPLGPCSRSPKQQLQMPLGLHTCAQCSRHSMSGQLKELLCTSSLCDSINNHPNDCVQKALQQHNSYYTVFLQQNRAGWLNFTSATQTLQVVAAVPGPKAQHRVPTSRSRDCTTATSGFDHPCANPINLNTPQPQPGNTTLDTLILHASGQLLLPGHQQPQPSSLDGSQPLSSPPACLSGLQQLVSWPGPVPEQPPPLNSCPGLPTAKRGCCCHWLVRCLHQLLHAPAEVSLPHAACTALQAVPCAGMTP